LVRRRQNNTISIIIIIIIIIGIGHKTDKVRRQLIRLH